ncbi:MAG: DegT/DnrJ/EryC1/StrS family aminotransferase [Candidatus Hermodarchaeia archaeon]|jgi:dTDP-4-amino-4,6-dideoxygalactose transaminase
MMIDFLDKKQISYADIESILAISDQQNHFTNDGPVKKNLEVYLERVLQLDDDKRVICCCNGTAALHSIMYLCTNKHNTRKWVTPAFTFPSCVVGHGLDIDVLDIDPDTYTLPLDNTIDRYDGVVITNLFGSYVDLEEWTNFCSNHNKVLILDNAASFLSSCNGVNICYFGDYSFGSLHHTKYMGFGEGGFIVCPEGDYDALNSIANFGFFGDRIHRSPSSNFKMSDVSAAFILNHIANYDLAAHVDNQNKLVSGVSNMTHADPFNYKPGTIYNTFPVVFAQEADESEFSNYGICAHKYYKPLAPLGNSISLYNRIINLPLYASLSDKQIDHILNTISKVR